MKSVLLIGLGRFGRHMAAKLQELHHEVLAVDKNEERVNEALDLVTHAQIGDSTSEAFIASLGVRNFDLCVVAIGDDFQSSLETTALLKEQGARFVLSRAARDVHAKFLLRNGADDVVYPERETASWAEPSVGGSAFFTPGRKRPVCIPCRVWYNGCITQEKSGGEGMAEILVVDDEAAIADLVEVCLKNEGYTVYKCGSGEAALTCVARQHLDLAILDVMLPDLDGFTLCQKIREEHLFPILMLTARVEDMDKIMGLTLGADDYITKPFNPLELVARVKTQLRRYTRYNTGEAAEPRETAEHDFRGLQISRTTHKCVLFGEELALTPLEFAILWYLCEHRGQVVPSEELFEAVWGEKYMDSNNTVMSHIARLREKMHEPSRKPKFIKTVWGVGYTIE